jgi:hypothetical protein
MGRMLRWQAEKSVLEAALQHEITAQATSQAELAIFRAKLHEAVRGPMLAAWAGLRLWLCRRRLQGPGPSGGRATGGAQH